MQRSYSPPHPHTSILYIFLLQDSCFFYQSFLGLGLGKLSPARESLVSDIPAVDGNIAKPFFTMYLEK